MILANYQASYVTISNSGKIYQFVINYFKGLLAS